MLYIYRRANGIYIYKYLSKKVAICSLWTVCPCFIRGRFQIHPDHNQTMSLSPVKNSLLQSLFFCEQFKGSFYHSYICFILCANSLFPYLFFRRGKRNKFSRREYFLKLMTKNLERKENRLSKSNKALEKKTAKEQT